MTYANPVIAVLLGVVLLGEPFGAHTVAGFALVAAGCWLSTRRPAAERSRPGGERSRPGVELGGPGVDVRNPAMEPGRAAVEMATKLRGASNAKAKRELAWTPRYPSWREGFPAVYSALAVADTPKAAHQS